jgi:hypothetical protein
VSAAPVAIESAVLQSSVASLPSVVARECAMRRMSFCASWCRTDSTEITDGCSVYVSTFADSTSCVHSGVDASRMQSVLRAKRERASFR